MVSSKTACFLFLLFSTFIDTDGHNREKTLIIIDILKKYCLKIEGSFK